MQELVAHQETINRQLARYGVKFGIYKNGEFKERLFPFDPLPRVIPAAEFAVLDKGLCQRVMALNMFLKDLYGDKKIIRDGVVPEDFAFAGSGYLPFYKEDLDYTLANLNKLVVKDVAEAGGYGVVFGRELTQEKLAELAGMIKREPRRFIAQEVIDFKDLPVMENGVQAERKADLRAFVLTGAETKVWPSGLTRFSREPDSFVVNSSQGGGFKDTWVLSD